MTPGYDLLASGILLGGSSVALALTAFCWGRANRAARRAEFAAANARASTHSAINSASAACGRAVDAGNWCEGAKRAAEQAMRAANAAELNRLFGGITVTRPETADVIPIPVPAPKLYEVEGVPGSIVAADDAGDVIEFGQFWRDSGGGEGGGDAA